MITIKTPEEIEILRQGGKRLASILAQVAKAVKPGVTGRELDKLARELIAKNSNGDSASDKPSFLNYTPVGEIKPFPAALCVSINEEIVHGIPSERELREGDIVGLDLGLNHQGLFTDHAVTVLVAESAKTLGVKDAQTPSVKFADSGVSLIAIKKLIEATREALAVGIKAARPGNTLGDIGATIEAVAKRNGLGLVRDLGGHGVGKRVHEEPHIPNFGKRGTGLKLKAGMVLALEPMFTLGTDNVKFHPDGYTVTTADNSLSAHFEHTIVITSTGAEILTKL